MYKRQGQVFHPHPLAQLIHEYKAIIFIVVAVAADPVSYTHLDVYKRQKLLIAADCTAYAYAAFHEKFMNTEKSIIRQKRRHLKS